MPAWPHVLPLTASFLNQCMSAAKLYTSGMPLLSAFTRPPSTKRKLGIVVAMLLLSVLVHLAVIEWLRHELPLIELLDDMEKNHGGLVGTATYRGRDELRLELSKWPK